MPELARFYGLVIKMFFVKSEHDVPHIHAIYGDYTGAVDIRCGEMIEGDLPAKAVALVQEWVELHRDALLEIWNTRTFKKLPPLV